VSTTAVKPAPSAMTEILQTRRGIRNGALERTLSGITQALERALFAEEISHQPGLFQGLDARAKVVLILAFLISVSLSRNLAVIVAIYCLVIILAWRSAISPGLLLRRVWLALPFFTGLIVVPAIFMIPGPALLRLPLGLVITRTGVLSALFLLLRVATSLSLTMLLILTTPWNTVLSALSVLRVPDVFVLMLGMTYRYIYVLLRTANDMFLSRKSRAVGRLSTADNQQMMASIAGTLLGKSLSLSNAVYLAMQSRGFRHTIVTLKPFQMQGKDWFWLTLLGGAAALSVVLGFRGG
jgi:cobalt/nickel transport system permease protein